MGGDSEEGIRLKTKVWVENPYPSTDTSHYSLALPHCLRPLYVPAIVHNVGDTVEVRTEWEPPISVVIPKEKVYPRNSNVSVENMSNLLYTHEAALLNYALRRFEANATYSFAGGILVAMNPYKELVDESGKSIYGKEAMQAYRQVASSVGWSMSTANMLPPHAFNIADVAMKRIFNTKKGKNQSIIISGESGAGKSENTKIILQYLANMKVASTSTTEPPRRPTRSSVVRGRRRRSTVIGSKENPFALPSSSSQGIQMKILQANPIMEAFGNSKTTRNDNSSRFGKYVDIGLDSSGNILGGRITNYLLEKSRVISQQEGERNYHIFYQMMAAVDLQDDEKFKLRDISWYRYLNVDSEKDHDDESNFDKLVEAMNFVGIDATMRDNIFRVCAAILLLGNLDFQCDEADDTIARVSQESLEILADIEELLDLENVLEVELCRRQLSSLKEVTYLPLTVEDAEQARNAFAKALYEKLFQWVMVQVNIKLAYGSKKYKSIGVLDIFGFEVFEHNTFEQLCINYANEKLHEYFTSQMFEAEAALYKNERVTCNDLKPSSANKEIVELIEGKPHGVLRLLEETCLFPHATDDSFLQKMHNFHKKNPHYVVTKGSLRYCFVINHSATSITYDVNGFVQKNQDKLAENLQVVMRSSKSILRDSFEAEDDSRGKNSAKGGLAGSKVFLASKFRADIELLIESLEATEPQFIKCIKPNSLKLPDVFDFSLVSNQFKYLGIADAIRIRLTGFAYRASFEDFLARFYLLKSSGLKKAPSAPDKKLQCQQFVEFLWKSKVLEGPRTDSMIEFGIHYVFCSQAAMIQLERNYSGVVNTLNTAAMLFQRRWMTYRGVKVRKMKLKSMVRIQSWWKSVYYTQKFHNAQHLVAKVKAQFRKIKIYRNFRKLRASTVKVQANYRGHIGRIVAQKRLACITKAQCYIRGTLARIYATERRAARVVLWSKLPPVYRNYALRKRQLLIVLHYQSKYRGWKARNEMPDTLLFLEKKRFEIKAWFSVILVQRVFRGFIERARYRQLKSAVRFFSHWYTTKLRRKEFLFVKSQTHVIQKWFRRYLARNERYRIETELLVKKLHEGLLTKIRQEATEFIAMDKVVLESISTTSKCEVFQVFDINLLHDSYKVSWAKSLSNLQAKLLKQHAHHLSRVGVHRIAISSNQTAVLTCHGTIFVRDTEKTDWSQIGAAQSVMKNKKIIDIVAGKNHFLALSEDGNCYSWGCNRYGQVGHVHRNSDKHRIHRIKGIEGPVKSIAAGCYYSIATTSFGTCFTWGLPDQLGRGLKAASVENCLPQRIPNIRFRLVKSGWNFVCAIDIDERLFTWGNVIVPSGEKLVEYIPKRLWFQKEHDDNDDTRNPVIEQLDCGAQHAIALLKESREVFTWGCNAFGQLGFEDKVSRSSPTKLSSFKGVAVLQVSAGYRTSSTMIHERQRTICTWGEGGVTFDSSSSSFDKTERGATPARDVVLSSTASADITLCSIWSPDMSLIATRIKHKAGPKHSQQLKKVDRDLRPFMKASSRKFPSESASEYLKTKSRRKKTESDIRQPESINEILNRKKEKIVIVSPEKRRASQWALLEEMKNAEKPGGTEVLGYFARSRLKILSPTKSIEPTTEFSSIISDLVPVLIDTKKINSVDATENHGIITKPMTGKTKHKRRGKAKKH